jgi:hypothetical protein
MPLCTLVFTGSKSKGGIMDVESLRQELIAERRKLRYDNRKIESQFKNNACRFEEIARKLKDLEPIK